METFVEQRRNARTELNWPVSLWLPEVNRFFNVRSINISKGGALLSAPIAVPVRTGHIVEINFPRTKDLAKYKGSFARIKSGKVVRVDRKRLLDNASIDIAVQFTESLIS